MKKQLLFISLEHWDEIWRRNQFLAVRLQNNYAITFVGPELPFWQICKKKIKNYQNIKIKYVYKFFPDKYLGFLNRIFYSFQIKNFIRDMLWINDPAKYFLNAQQIIYDITDDWTLVNPKIIKADQKLCQKANKIIVCSSQLYKKYKKTNKPVYLVKNGINLEDYISARKLSRPEYFLYTGSLHEERLSVVLMIKMAQAFPQEKFLYVGPIFFRPATVKKLKAYSNIILAGSKAYREIPGYMAQAKALIVPHVVSSFVNSLDPIKQYEYMLSPLPVIATNVSGFKDWPSLYTIAKKDQAFLKALNQVIYGKIKVNIPARLRAARQNTWAVRARGIKNILCAKS